MVKKKHIKKQKGEALAKYSGSKSYIKGKLFEKILQLLLIKAGFSTDVTGMQVTLNQKKLHGRGATYDPDFFKQFSLGIPFINPLMLVLEAKNYNKPIGLKIVREFLGAFIDVSQYVRINTKKFGQLRYDVLFDTRYNYCPVIFSLKGFQKRAKGLMFAHGINFISYENSEIMANILVLLDELVGKINFSRFQKEDFQLFEDLQQIKNLRSIAKRSGFNIALDNFTVYLNKVNSLIGVLDFKYPVHILYEKSIAASYVRNVRIVHKKDNLFILENIVKRKFGEFSYGKVFLKEYIQYAQKRGLIDKILTEIDVVQVTKDTMTLRKLKIDETSKQELINELTNIPSETEPEVSNIPIATVG
ncbi:hypothetical protein M1271_05710 [Patescibacteria group bacterium]|nr:hypothetical protein [Patescibacteria group bacterium]